MKFGGISKKINYKKLSLVLILILIAVSIYLLSVRKTNSFLFFKENQILTFSSKTISTEKGSESSEFNVYLFKDLKSRRPESTLISSFNMPFHKDKIDNPRNEETDYNWYTIAEIGDNKWIFANCVNDGDYYLFDISYSAGKKSLYVNNLRKSVNNCIFGFITSYDKLDNYFLTTTGSFYNTDGKNLVTTNLSGEYLHTEQPTTGFTIAKNNEYKAQLITDTDAAACRLDHNNIVYYKNDQNTGKVLLTKITMEESIVNRIGNPSNKADSDNKANNLRIFKVLSTRAGRYIHFKSPPFDFAPLAVSPDRKKVAFTAIYSDCSDFKQSEDYENFMKRYESTARYLWLAVWDTQKNNVEKIIVIPSALSVSVVPFAMLWCPAKNSPLISYYCSEGLFLINTAKRTIKMIYNKRRDVLSIRWSPDGSMLGILDDRGYLYVYDVAKDSDFLLSCNPHYFNFVWVK